MAGCEGCSLAFGVIDIVFAAGSTTTLNNTGGSAAPNLAIASRPKINPSSTWCFIGRVGISA